MKEKHIALNTQLIPLVVSFFGLLRLAAISAADKDVVFAVVFVLFAAVVGFGCAISPLYVAFSEESVEIVYTCGKREEIRWSDIRSITAEGSWFAKGGGLPHFVLSFPRKEKKPFFVVGEIPRTRTTKTLIERYYKKKIKNLS